MHATSVLQITEDSLINNSCMSIQTKTQLRLKIGTMYYQLQDFSYKKISCMQKEFFLEICAVLQCVGALCEIIVTQGYSWITQGKLRKEIGGLEGRGEGI